jgi:hypothetical protein
MSQIAMFEEPRAEAMPFAPEVSAERWGEVHAFPSIFATVSERAAADGEYSLVKAGSADEAAWRVADDLLRIGIKHVEIVSVTEAK